MYIGLYIYLYASCTIVYCCNMCLVYVPRAHVCTYVFMYACAHTCLCMRVHVGMCACVFTHHCDHSLPRLFTFKY